MKRLAKGPMDVAEALACAMQIAEALDAAHRSGVIHRDLKPENIMLVREHDKQLAARVLDFGLAKLTGPIGENDATLVQSGHSAGIVGTLMYMAPEVLSGHVADARADQYSLALILYELLAGEHPLGMATDLASVVRGHTEVPVIPISDRVEDIPAGIVDTIARALSKKPQDRFDTVGQFIATLCRPGVSAATDPGTG